MDKKMPKKISLKDFGMEKIILIAIAGIVLLAANFSEWKNSSSKNKRKTRKIHRDKIRMMHMWRHLKIN